MPIHMEPELDNIINDLIKEDHYQKVINSEEFFFEKLKVLFNRYKTYSIASFKDKLEEFINNPPKEFHYKEFLEKNKDSAYYEFLELIGKMTSIFDGKGYNINEWNPYPDKRYVSPAIFTQKNWAYCFFKYLLDGFSFQDWEKNRFQFITFQYAINFIENPQQNVNITSQNHRSQICEYFKLKNDSEIITLFQDYTNLIKNTDNAGVLVASILYHPNLARLWQDSVIGLMASDSTGWQDEFIRNAEGHNACIVWNSKGPTGKKDTLKFLHKILRDDGSFNLYYSSFGVVNYLAEIVDFVVTQRELDEKDWPKKYGDIYGFHKDFAEYIEGRKSAKIVFLASTLTKVQNIPVSDFRFYKDYSPPRQDNLSPVMSAPETFEQIGLPIISKDMSNRNLFLNLILFGPPGTGKTYNSINKALDIVAKDFYDKNKENRNALTDKFRKLLYDPETEKGQIAFVTFHQSLCYEDFIEGIKPLDPDENEGQVVYDVVPGIFRQFCNSASSTGNNFQERIEWLKKKCSEADNQVPLKIKTKSTEFTISYREGKTFRIKPMNTINPGSDYQASIDNIRKVHEGASRRDVYNPTYVVGILDYLYANGLKQGKSKEVSDKVPYVMIIDEINRGNISQIFGELITLIEKDKRKGEIEELEVILPYSREKFGVPPNLYIIGTMNTADRSVEALDTALRRRFCFEEMSPLYDLDELKYKIADNEAHKILITINKRIEKLLDKDHLIGHSYFMLDKKEEPVSKLKNAFHNNIIPLLQEYFFGDFGKIGLVMGEGFFENAGKQDEENDKIFALFNDYDVEELENRPVFKIKNCAEMSDEEFISAVRLLMK